MYSFDHQFEEGTTQDNNSEKYKAMKLGEPLQKYEKRSNNYKK